MTSNAQQRASKKYREKRKKSGDDNQMVALRPKVKTALMQWKFDCGHASSSEAVAALLLLAGVNVN